MEYIFETQHLGIRKFVEEDAPRLYEIHLIDDMLKSDIDNPSIGLILCRDKNKVVAEYARK